MYAAYRYRHYYGHTANCNPDVLEVIGVFENLAAAEECARNAENEQSATLRHGESATPSFGASDILDADQFAGEMGFAERGTEWADWCRKNEITDCERYGWIVAGGLFCAATDYGMPLVAQ